MEAGDAVPHPAPGYEPLMSPRGALAAMLVLFFVLTLVEAASGLRQREQPLLWTIVSTLLSSFLPFYWFRLDRESRGWPRSRWLSTAIVTLTLFAVPYYLVRSRPKGGKLRGFLRFVGFLLLMLAVSVAGGMLALLLG